MIITEEPESFTFRFVWDTDVRKMQNGSEQRESRIQYPGIEVDAEFVFDNEEAMRAIRAALFTGPTTAHEIAFWPMEGRVTGSTAANNIKVAAKDSAMLAAIGNRLFLRKAGEDDHIATVTGVALAAGVYTLTLNPAPAAGLREAGVSVMPLLGIYLYDEPTTSRWRLQNGMRWSLRAVSRVYFANLGLGGDDPSEHDTMLLLDAASVVAKDETLAEQHQGGVMGVSLPGTLESVSLYDFADIARQCNFSWHNSTDRQWWLNFLLIVEGRRQPFLHPTWRKDLLTDTDPVDGSNELLVLDDPDYRPWWAAVSHKRLAVMWDDGTFQPVTVEDITDNLDGTLTLGLASNIVVPSGATFLQLSFLEVVRLANDTVEFKYDAGAATIDLPLVVVQDEPE